MELFNTRNTANLTFAFLLAISSTSGAAELCRSIFDPSEITPVEKVVISEKQFDQSTKDLRATLSGKLATVWRSEWKTKLNVNDSNQYVLEMVEKSLTPDTRQAALQGLDIKNEGFTRLVHERMYELQTANRLTAGDDLMVRDKPAPLGAKDTTFTYYTKPIVNAAGEGKHQIRVRTYLREISYDQIPVGQSVHGFDSQGKTVIISKTSLDTYKVTIGTELSTQSESAFSLAQMRSQFGTTARFFAPHGKSFKLEVKTALNDEISNDKFPLLAGKHMVQKLDVTLSPAQVSKLFAPLKSIETAQRVQESLNRIETLSAELVDNKPDIQSRSVAVFNVLKEGVRTNPDYLVIEGATVYHRTAFESQSGFQTTIDRDQGVYSSNMYTSTSLKSPITTVKENHLIKTGFEDARHVELKVPVTSIQNTVGIAFHDPHTAPAPQNIDKDAKIVDAVMIFSDYVKNSDHSGKFNYIRKEGIR